MQSETEGLALPYRPIGRVGVGIIIRLTRAPTLAANSNHLRGRSTQLQLLQTILLRALCTFQVTIITFTERSHEVCESAPTLP